MQSNKALLKKDVVIIGAGASGLMCAVEAGKRKRSVLVLEHNHKLGKKIRISGGGSCNFTNLYIKADNYLSENPHFCKSAIARFGPHDFLAMLESHGIRYHEKEQGQLFCSGTSADIVTMFQKECTRTGIDISLNCTVERVRKKAGLFSVATQFGDVEASALVVATGGLSYPELGATDLGFRLAEKFGMKITRLKPALVPLLFDGKDLQKFSELSGASFDAAVSSGGRQFRGKVLFTHRGLSGPAILQASLHWNPGDEITIDPLPDRNAYELLKLNRTSRRELSTVLSEYLPKRFSQLWCTSHAPSRPLYRYTERELKDIAQQLHQWTIRPEGTEGYRKAEITAGGIDTGELSSKTMEAKKVPGLFFIGEVVDVSGQLGGYNLQWAWSSGFSAGQYV
jgi:hypothetical protein